MKILTILKVFLIIILSILIHSCKSESYILNASKFYTNKADKKYQIDSFKVVNVIDNRETKDSVIGIADMEGNHLTIDKPLVDYLKLGFNTLICKDSNQTNYIPVTVYVDEFYSKRFAAFWKQAVNHKFSYLFEYPYRDEIKRLRIMDSLLLFDDPSVAQQIGLMNRGIRESARFFTAKLKDDKLLDTVSVFSKEQLSEKGKIDSINLVPARIFEFKNGFLGNYYFGQKTQFGFLLSYLMMFHPPGARGEVGYGYSFQYYKINYDDNEGSLYGLNTPLIIRYNLTDNLNGLFLGCGLSIIYGTEKAGYLDYKFFVGGRIEESIGYYLTKNIALNAGFYQMGLFGSRLLPTDIGLVFSLSITSDYSLK
ncbi:MAG: hypothetical protein HZB41_13840 [Ignavibacteriae bacterium]|nr:hypothetical protein [Ignavibacteriota bacterium]